MRLPNAMVTRNLCGVAQLAANLYFAGFYRRSEEIHGSRHRRRLH